MLGAPSGISSGFAASFHTGSPLERALSFDEKTAAVNELLKHTTAITFNERLTAEAESTDIMDYGDVIKIGVEIGLTEKEAADMVATMHNSGCLLRVYDAVYLKPSEMVEALVEKLPMPTADNSKLVAEYEIKLAAIREELSPLEEKMDSIHRSSNSRARSYLWLGLFLLVFQLGAFIRLTFWELSWDVMEPIGFFVQLFAGIIGYTWFMLYGTEMTYGNIYESYYGAGKKRKLSGMDELAEKHKSLMRQMKLYEKFLRWAKK